MRQLIKMMIASLLVGAGGGAAEPSGGFFEFSSAPVVEAIEQNASDVLVFQGLEIKDGFIRISGQSVTHVEGDGVTDLPELPVSLSNPGAALVGSTLYVVSGVTLLKLDLDSPDAGWVECSKSPEDSVETRAAVSLQDSLYIIGESALLYHPARDEWQRLTSPPEDLSGFVAASCGNDHLLFFNAKASDDRILAYHRITGEWLEMGRLPEKVKVFAAASSGTEFALFTSDSVVSAKALLKPTKYGWVDHSVVAGLVLALVGVGMYFSKKEKSSGDYFRAGNRIPWWAAGLSLFASGASAISLMAMPGKAFADNWIYFSISLFVVVVQLPLMLLVYIPIIRRLNIATANEYLERRYGLPVRMLGFVIYSLNQMMGRMAAILLLPSIALSAIFGLPMEQSILIMGVVATIYVTLGGLEAVIWTDVLQATVMLLAVLTCCFWAFFSLDMTVPAAREVISGMNKLQVFDFSFDWTAPVFLIVFSNVVSMTLGMIGDQTFIQRVQCTHDEKESRKTILTQLAVAVPMNIVLFALGTLLFLFYKTRPEILSPALKSDGIFPFFAAQTLPPGMAGFVVAALLAATMSTVSGAINSVANLGVEDVYRRFFPKATDHKCLIVGRTLTISLGVFGTGAALLLARTSLLSVWDLALMITGMILAPITGIFVLGIFTTRTNSFGVWVGTVASIAANYYAKFCMNLHALAYLTVGVFACIIVGYLASFLAPQSKKNLDGLTAYTLLEK
ncbi:sodium:solute symporter family transporter [Tichowtungia aerotolerans]|uniref:Sodium/solute symporter n=1 Tax=Tichowtungia aerotolerans TaxID=2697043 RepID=A0A6P1MB13_9BACT|nr:sodium/solute symporter [Tichowtungia aerotolerans]QHI69288.1 sodium/solute symporter [Tichowtungia aerotolerans]